MTRGRDLRRALTALFALVALAGIAIVRSARADAPTGAGARPDVVESFTLSNGLAVFVRPIAGATGAFVEVLYTIGDGDDPAGAAGLAHLLERVYRTAPAGFVGRGTHTVETAVDQRHESSVGSDFTSFCDGAPADRLRLLLREAADRMGDLRIEEIDLARATPVATEKPGPSADGSAARHAQTVARDRLRLLRDPRGSAVPIASHSLDSVRERWRRFYKPANALLVVAGDVDPALVRAGVHRLFDGIPAGEPIRRPPLIATQALLLDSPTVFVKASEREGDGASSLAIAVPRPATTRALASALVLWHRLRSQDEAADRAARQAELLALLRDPAAADGPHAPELSGPPDETERQWLERLGVDLFRRLDGQPTPTTPDPPATPPASPSPPAVPNLTPTEHAPIARTSKLTEAVRAALRAQRAIRERQEASTTMELLGDSPTIVLTRIPFKAPAEGGAVAALRKRLADAAVAPPTPSELEDVRADFGVRFLLTTRDPEERYPCAVAFGIARRAQYGIEGEAVLEELDHVTAADLAAAASQPSIAVVVSPSGK